MKALHEYQDGPAEGPSTAPMCVIPDWLMARPLQQQSVVILAARGPDGVRKHHPCKGVVRAYRGTVLRAAKYGRFLNCGEEADTFMCLKGFDDHRRWVETIVHYMNHIDELPHHYHNHLMHGAQVLAEAHPDPVFQRNWRTFYLLCVDNAHLRPESSQDMNERLGDWGRQHWE